MLRCFASGRSFVRWTVVSAVLGLWASGGPRVALADGVAEAPASNPAAGSDAGAPRSDRPAAPNPPTRRLVPLVDVFATWVPQGPGATQNGQVRNITNGEVVGAVQAIVPHPTDADTVWIGTVGGGVWKTTNATAATPNWTPLTDFQPTTTIGDLRPDPTDGTSNTLLAGFGDFSNWGGSGTSLNGLLRTTDGGSSWTFLTHPLLQGQNVTAVVARGTTLLAGSTFGGALFRSPDTGVTWTQVSGALGSGLPLGSCGDLGEVPGVPTRLYCAVLGNGIYRSDGVGGIGATWSLISNSDATLDGVITGGGNGSTLLAVGSSGRLYAGVVVASVLSWIGYTDDPESVAPTWVQMDLPGVPEQGIHPGPQGTINFSLQVDPVTETTIYVGGDRQENPAGFPNQNGATGFTAQLWRGDTTQASGTGGPGFLTPSAQWEHMTDVPTAMNPNGGTAGATSPHADSRDLEFDASGRLLEADDGGIYFRTSPQDNTGDWDTMNGDLQCAEAHDSSWDSVSAIASSGCQDTGSPRQIASGLPTWDSLNTADGGDAATDDVSGAPALSLHYHSSQQLGGFTRRWNDATNTPTPPFADNPALAPNDAFPVVPGNGGNCPFRTPVVLNNILPTSFVIGGNTDIWETLDLGATTTDILPGTGCPNSAAIDYGGGGNVNALWVGSGGNVFFRSGAHPGSVLTATGFNATAGTGNVTAVAMARDDATVCWATDGDQVWMTTTSGVGAWTDVTGNLTTDFGATNFNCLESIEDLVADAVVIGANNGVYVMREDAIGTWQKLGSGLPSTAVFDLEWDPSDDTLMAATMGRGTWTVSNVTAAVDVTAPTVACSIGRRVLYPTSRGLLDVGATFTAVDDFDPVAALSRVVSVTSDEAAGAAPYAPDGTFTQPPPRMRLRAERAFPGSGRIYLVQFGATDATGNSAVDCCTAVVPLNVTVSHLTALLAEAAFVEASCDGGGGAPVGYDNPILAPTPILP